MSPVNRIYIGEHVFFLTGTVSMTVESTYIIIIIVIIIQNSKIHIHFVCEMHKLSGFINMKTIVVNSYTI